MTNKAADARKASRAKGMRPLSSPSLSSTTFVETPLRVGAFGMVGAAWSLTVAFGSGAVLPAATFLAGGAPV